MVNLLNYYFYQKEFIDMTTSPERVSVLTHKTVFTTIDVKYIGITHDTCDQGSHAIMLDMKQINTDKKRGKFCYFLKKLMIS